MKIKRPVSVYRPLCYAVGMVRRFCCCCMAHHSKPDTVLHSKEMMMTLLMGHVDSEMEWAIKEPMKLPNCMQALYKQNTRYKGM